MSECLECGAPCDAVEWCIVDGVGFDGRDERVWMDLYVCAAGHRYHLVNEDKTVKA